jgi:hypothetical protein
MKREIVFQQTKSNEKSAIGTIQIELPENLTQLGKEIEISANNKVLPMYEGKIIFEVALSDGVVTTFEGNLALWPNKQHSKAALEAVRQAKREEEKRRKEETKQKLLAGLTPEQIRAFKELGIL